jgi:hypothetical protein
MIAAKARQGSIFEGFQIGSVLASVLIAAGIEAVIAVLSRPFASAFVDSINYIIRVGRFQTIGLAAIDVSWSLMAIIGIPAIVVLLCGLRLAAWLSQGVATGRATLR